MKAMMDILFMIGNGFDIRVGFNTSLKSILKKYISTKSTDNVISEFKDAISTNLGEWSDFEKYMGKYTNKFHADSDINKAINTYMTCISDFEKFMRDFIRGEEGDPNRIVNHPEISSVFENSILKFYTYLDAVSQQEIVALIDSPMEFKFINFNYTDIFDNCISELKRNKSLLPPEMINNKNITYSITKCIGGIFHIHGTLTENVLLGVDNMMQIENEEFRNNIRINDIVKPLMNDSLQNNNNEIFSNTIDNSSLYLIYGMSIGETDKKWWMKIVENLKDENKRLVIFVYEENFDPSDARNRINIMTKWKKRFISQLYPLLIEASEQYKEIARKIYVIINSKIFDLNLKLTNHLVDTSHNR
jgi:hypothetical protein